MPVELRVEFEDGRSVTERWDGRARWKRFEYAGAKLVRATVDPGRKLAIDVDPVEQRVDRRRRPARRGRRRRWAARFLLWLQTLLERQTALGEVHAALARRRLPLALLRNCGLVLLVLASNLGARARAGGALLQRSCVRDLVHTGASSRMMYGFDYEWWSRFDASTHGFASAFAPDLAGIGFVYRNLDLLLRGAVPGGLFSGGAGADPALLGLGLVYLAAAGLPHRRPDRRVPRARRRLDLPRPRPRQRLLFRPPAAREPAGAGRRRPGVRGLRAPGALDERLAEEAVSERSALAIVLGRSALLLVALVCVHAVSSFAKVIVVCEERRSAVLAVASSLGFCARNPGAVAGQYLALGVLGLALVALFSLLDGRLLVSGWSSQLVALALFEAFVAARIALRLGLLAGQVELQQAGGRPRG